MKVILQQLQQQHPHFQIKDLNGLIFVKKRLFITTRTSQNYILHLCHDALISGHRGQRVTEDLTRRKFWCPSLHQGVVKFVVACEIYAQSKS